MECTWNMTGVHRSIACWRPASQEDCRLSRECSFAVNGPRLFNSIPKNIREYIGSPDSFKKRLDNFLLAIPEVPVLLGQPQATNCNSLNSSVVVLRQQQSQNWITSAPLCLFLLVQVRLTTHGGSVHRHRHASWGHQLLLSIHSKIWVNP